MKRLNDFIPDAADLSSLQPEEIGSLILQILSASSISEPQMLNAINFVSERTLENYPKEHRSTLMHLLMEGWVWLVSEGLIAQIPEHNDGWVFITRKGKALANQQSMRTYIATSSLRKELLHPVIAEKAWSAYLREDFDTAIFIAFKEIEINVRKNSQQRDESVGVDLVRKAFNVDGGALAPTFLPKAEREALMHLFAGAMGWFKNPQSHREVGMTHVKYAAQALMFASHLLYLAEMSLPGKIVRNLPVGGE